MRKISLIFITILSLSLLFVFPFTVNGLQLEEGYVTDSALILSEDTEEYIEEYSEVLNKKTGIDFYVVTIKNTEDLNIEEYTDYVFDEFNIDDEGILILASYEDRMIRVKVEGDISLSFTESEIDEFINSYFMPFLKKNKWDMGIKNGYNSFYKYILQEEKLDSSDIVVYDDVDFITKYKEIILFIVIWLNTMLSYFFCKYFINSYKKELKFSLIDSILFGVILFVNILLLAFVYYIDHIALIIIFLMELFAIYTNITSERLNNVSIKNSKSIKKMDKKKRVLCYNKKQGGKHEKKRSR